MRESTAQARGHPEPGFTSVETDPPDRTQIPLHVLRLLQQAPRPNDEVAFTRLLLAHGILPVV